MALAAAVAAAQVLAWVLAGVEARTLLADPAELTGAPSWTGAVSFLGVAAWLTATTAAGLAAWILPAGQPLRCTLLHLAGLSLLFAVDDQFRMHEEFARVTGGPEAIPQVIYLLIALEVARRHTRAVRPEWPLFGLAVAGLGTSLAMDASSDLLELQYRGEAFFEDNAKFLGVTAWATATAHVARRALRGPTPPDA